MSGGEGEREGGREGEGDRERGREGEGGRESEEGGWGRRPGGEDRKPGTQSPNKLFFSLYRCAVCLDDFHVGEILR